MELTTPRLLLIPITAEFLQAAIARDHVAAGALYQVTVPPTWPGDRGAIEDLPIQFQALRAEPNELLWRVRLVVMKEDRIAIGSINLHGPPRDGCVEIGWWLIPSLRGMGFAREAAIPVIDWLKAQPDVRRIIATIDDSNAASIRIAIHLGMHKTAERQRDRPIYQLEDW